MPVDTLRRIGELHLEEGAGDAVPSVCRRQGELIFEDGARDTDESCLTGEPIVMATGVRTGDPRVMSSFRTGVDGGTGEPRATVVVPILGNRSSRGASSSCESALLSEAQISISVGWCSPHGEEPVDIGTSEE